MDSVELKLTVPETRSGFRSTAASLDMDPLQAQIRQVFFFDTPDLLLNQHGLVVRARRSQGRVDDSVVKLRPVVPDELPPALRKLPEFKVEVDVLPGSYVCSGSFKAKLGQTDVREASLGRRPIRKLFTKAQRAFYADHAPEGLDIDDAQHPGADERVQAEVPTSRIHRGASSPSCGSTQTVRGSWSCPRRARRAKPSRSPPR